MAKREFFTQVRNRALLSLVQTANDNHAELGFNEFFQKARTLPQDERVGSPVTLQSWIARAEQRRWIRSVSVGLTGRGNKIGYVATEAGRRYIGNRALSEFPVSATESLEVPSLLNFNEYGNHDRSCIVYSNANLSEYVSQEVIQEALDDLNVRASRIAKTLQEAIMWKQHTPKMRRGDRLTDEEYETLDGRLRFLEHREGWAESFPRKPLGKARVRARRIIFSERPSNPPSRLQEFATKHEVRGNQFGNYDLSWDWIEARKLVEECGRRAKEKGAEYQLPLSQGEYKELVELRKLWNQYWSITHEPRPTIAILLSSGLSEQLVEKGQLVEVPSQNDQPLYRTPRQVARQMSPEKLRRAEREYWEATHTSKYAYQIEFYLRSGDEEVLTHHILGPDQLFKFGIGDPDLGPRLRKMYFATVHKAISSEVQARHLKPLTHNQDATYKDSIDWLEKEHREFGSDRKILHERKRVTVVYRLSPKDADLIRKYQPKPAPRLR